MQRYGPALVIALALGAVAVVQVAAADGDAVLRLALGGSTALAWLLALAGAGGAALGWLAPDLAGGPRGALRALAVGLVLWGLLGFAVAAAGVLALPALVATAGLLAAGWLACPRLALPRPGPWVALALLLVGVPGLLNALAPPVSTDELYLHLALARQMLDRQGLLGGLLHPDGSRPQALGVPFAMLLASGGESAPRLFHLLLGLGTVAWSADLAREHGGPRAAAAAALLLATSWTVASEAGLAGNNLPAAFLALATLDAALAGRAGALALLAGGALALKYTAGGAVAGAFLVARLPWRQRALAALGALVVVAPWWARNLAEGLHPLFPYGGWPGELRFQYLDKYGAGRDLPAMLLLPWNAVMTAETDSFRFLGRLQAVLLPLGLAALWQARRPGPGRSLVVASLAAGLYWALGPHWLRHLVPGLGLLATAAGLGLAGLPRTLAPLALLAGLASVPANLGPLLVQAADRFAVATGAESRDAFLERHVPSWPAVRWANAHLPPEARVALFFDWSTYLLDRDAVLGSVEDHVPTRHWLLTHGDDSLAALRRAGVTHLLVGRTRFIGKVYPFLPPADLETLFNGPVERLDELLLMQAILVYERDRVRIYRLDAGPGAATP